MRLTNEHVSFWNAKHPRPRWMGQLPAAIPPRGVSLVHHCVNSHAGPPARHLESGNLLTLLNSVRRRKGPAGLRAYLRELATQSENKRSAAFARKWLRRMEGSANAERVAA